MRNLIALTLTLLVSAPALFAEPDQPKEKKPVETKKGAKESPSEDKKETEKQADKKKKRTPKVPVSAPDYAQWERLDPVNRKLSPNGQWLAYGVARVDETSELHLHHLKGRKMPRVETYKLGQRPVFSNDSAWLAVTMGKTPEEKKKSPNAKGSTLHLRHLADGKTTEFKNVKSLTFSDDSRFAALEVAGESSDKNALIVRDLKNGTDTAFGNVTRFAWSDQGSHLAFVVDSPTISNSLLLFEPSIGFLHTLESSEQEYAGLRWRKESYDLAVMREMKHAKGEDTSHHLLLWRNLNRTASERYSFDHTSKKGFPKDMFIPAGSLTFSRDGQSLYLDLRTWEKKPKALEPKKKKEPAKKEEPKKDGEKPEAKSDEKPAAKPATKPKDDSKEKKASMSSAFEEKPSKTLREKIQNKSNVEIWHTKDTEIMPLQKRLGAGRKNPKRRAVWWPEQGKVVQLATELTERVSTTRGGRYAIGFDLTPHDKTAMFGPRLQDVYSINTTTGKRKLIIEGVKYALSTSPDGRYLIFLRDGHIWSHNLKSGKELSLTASLDTHFTNQQDDTLAEEKRPFGNGFWLKDSSGVLFYDRYDIWLLAPDGSRSRRLTRGKEKEIRHRLSQATFHEDDQGLINPKKPLLVALYGEWTKKSGYGSLPSLAKPGELKTFLWDDKAIMNLTRARDAGKFIFTKEAADDSPDLFVSGTDLSKARQISRTNTFQKKYRWGHSELINFENDHGVKLQGSLRYPANYQKGKKYPMVVYIYEKRSQDLHRYYIPTEKHPYNPTVFSAEGYFVFQPDIVYRPQEPGVSALECVVPAVKEVLKTGMIDEKKVGLFGHSWGAYQTAFIVTRSDLFAAGVAGAPLTNMMSMSVSVYWNSGQTNAAIFTQSQGRMNKPFWRDVDTYIRNSPIHGLDSLNTPLLIAFGDKDGAVDWGQGVQMYNAARWAGKENMVMLVYPGENHGLRKPENMVDYHYRVREWFDTHVKGNEAPKWITDGKSFLEREKEKTAKPKPAAKPAAKPTAKPEAKPADKPDAKPTAKADPKSEAKPAAKADPKTEAKPTPKKEAKAAPKKESKASPKKEEKAPPKAKKARKKPAAKSK